MFARKLQFTSSALCLALLSGAAVAQCGMTQLLASDRQSGDRFGTSVSMSASPSGISAAIGAPFDDTNAGADAGSVYMFLRLNGIWGQTTKVEPLNGNGGPADKFGTSVGLSDPWMVVGAPFRNDTGGAYFFGRFGSQWAQDAVVSNNQIGSEFGASVGLAEYNGTWAIVGAPQDDFHGQMNAGAAYVYRRTGPGTWTLELTIHGADYQGSTGDHRGTSVAISKDSQWAAVGIPDREHIGLPTNHGAVDVVRRTATDAYHAGTIVPYETQADAQFGYSVAVSGNWMAIGAPGMDSDWWDTPEVGPTTNAGCFYLYYYSNQSNEWVLLAREFAPDATPGARMGSKIAIDGDRVVIGCEASGKAYVYEPTWGTWSDNVLDVIDPDSPDEFGKAGVAVLGDAVVIGDPADDFGGLTNQGAAYALTVGEPQSDTCAGAIEITLGTEGEDRHGCTALATPSGFAASTCGGGGTGADVWYRWRPTCSGNIIIDTFGSAFDTVLSVHTDCPVAGNLHQVACNDDGFASPERDSLLTFNFTAGQTYLIRVSGYNGAEGSYTLRMVPIYPSITNDTCAGATTVSAGDYPLSTCVATTENGDPSCAGVIFRDRWYRYVAPASGTVEISTCVNNFDTILAVYEGSCPAAGDYPDACDDDGCPSNNLGSLVNMPVTQGMAYLIRVGGFGVDDMGNVTLHIGDVVSCDPDVNCDGSINGFDIEAMEQAVNGDMTNFCQADPDYNRDGSVNGFDIEAVEQGVNGAPCP